MTANGSPWKPGRIAPAPPPDAFHDTIGRGVAADVLAYLRGADQDMTPLPDYGLLIVTMAGQVLGQLKQEAEVAADG
jgi:hypothetical protein